MATEEELQHEREENAGFERLMRNSGNQLRDYSIRDTSAYQKGYDEDTYDLPKKLD